MKEALKSLAEALQEKDIEKVKWWISAAIKDLSEDITVSGRGD